MQEAEVEPTLPGTEDTGLLGGLDPDQRAAASIADGPVLIIAGPGTGKTRTLTHRIAHLVSEQGVPPTQCLALTFTRRAAEEMRERLAVLVPDQADAILVTTFHGLGLRLLREAPERVGLTPAFEIVDDEDDLADPKELRARDLVDIRELVELPVGLLAENPDLVTRYRERWRYVSVDEYQDIDETQYRLLRSLVPADGNLCAIGDPDQAIYGFRGADVEFFLRFTADNPAARTVRLGRNYRSTRPILTAATQAIAPGTLVSDRTLEPVRRDTEPAPVRLYEAATPDAEAAFVSRTIDQLLGGSSYHSLDSGRVDGREQPVAALSFSDIAVLYRTDARSRSIVESFTRSGVPFQKRSHDRLLERPGVRAIAEELRFADGPGSNSLTDRIRRTSRTLLDRFPDREAELHNAVELLMPLASRCDNDAERLLTELTTGVEVDALDPRADRVSLLTVHAAKGLEFDVVFLVGCEDGMLPFRWPGSRPTPEELDEERRLFFVGLTRARSYLYLSHVRQRMDRDATRSPFLDAIGWAVLERLGEPVPPKPKPQQHRLF